MTGPDRQLAGALLMPAGMAVALFAWAELQ